MTLLEKNIMTNQFLFIRYLIFISYFQYESYSNNILSKQNLFSSMELENLAFPIFRDMFANQSVMNNMKFLLQKTFHWLIKIQLNFTIYIYFYMPTRLAKNLKSAQRFLTQRSRKLAITIWTVKLAKNASNCCYYRFFL